MTSPLRTLRAALGATVGAALAATLHAPPAAAWTPQSQIAIAEQAARISPPDLRRQIERHAAEFRAGVLAPFREAGPERHVKNPDGSGELDLAFLAEVDGAIAAIRDHRPFAETVRRLGAVAHYAADANNPLNASEADPGEGVYFADYLRYAESALPRFTLVFYGLDPGLRDPRGVSSLLDRALRRGRDLYPLIGLEYRRVGGTAGVVAFDDRSTAFGVAAVAASHAVSDTARTLRYIWIRAGGIDDRTGLPVLGRLPAAASGLSARGSR